MSEIRVGTSGWHYEHWRGNFYEADRPPARYLEHYITRFDTVEINQSYYRLPTPETLHAWYKATPKNFLFSFKASRFLTHNKKLKDPQDPLNRVLRSAEVLRDKLGPILFQLGPHWRLNLERLQSFLSILPNDFQYVFEFREPSWFCEPVYAALEKRKIPLCLYSMAGVESPQHLTAPNIYIRFHGAEGKYNGDYPMAVLRRWADSIRQWSRSGYNVLVYFNNDPFGHAPKNAQELLSLLGHPLARPQKANRRPVTSITPDYSGAVQAKRPHA